MNDLNQVANNANQPANASTVANFLAGKAVNASETSERDVRYVPIAYLNVGFMHTVVMDGDAENEEIIVGTPLVTPITPAVLEPVEIKDRYQKHTKVRMKAENRIRAELAEIVELMEVGERVWLDELSGAYAIKRVYASTNVYIQKPADKTVETANTDEIEDVFAVK